MHAQVSQRRPTQAHDNHAGQQWPTTANAGQNRPLNDSQQKPTHAHDSPRFAFSFCFIHTNKILLPPGLTTTRPDPEGQQTQAHDCHRRLPQELENAVAAGARGAWDATRLEPRYVLFDFSFHILLIHNYLQVRQPCHVTTNVAISHQRSQHRPTDSRQPTQANTGG